jgi:hypothetical protein
VTDLDLDTHMWIAPALLPPESRRDFGDRLAYCVPDGDGTRAGDLVCEHGTDTVVRYRAAPAAAERVRALLHLAYQRALTGRAPTRQVLADTTSPSTGTPLESHAESGPADSLRVGPGLRVARSGHAVLVRALDELFLDLALELGATEFTVPGLVAWSTLERAEYARNYPQHLTSCAVVRHDLEALDRFADARGAEERAAELEPAPVALAPSVCLNVFAALADSSPRLPLLVTARGTCARYEAGSADSPTRLWTFSMRELICLGDQATVRRFRDESARLFGRLAADLGLPARVVTANDPFFTHEAPELTAFQSAFALKHELCALPAGGGPELAVASVNLHNQHFGTSLGIRGADGAPVSSACVGFGLERWAHWIAGYRGTDPAGWPPALRARAERPRRGDLPGLPQPQGDDGRARTD